MGPRGLRKTRTCWSDGAPANTDGAIRLSRVQLGALMNRLDWARVYQPRRTQPPIESRARPCCAIDEDVCERLDIVPTQPRVSVTRRPKYACRACEEGVVPASAPARLIEGGLPTEAPASILGADAPRCASRGPTPATIGPGTGTSRPAWLMSTNPWSCSRKPARPIDRGQ